MKGLRSRLYVSTSRPIASASPIARRTRQGFAGLPPPRRRCGPADASPEPQQGLERVGLRLAGGLLRQRHRCLAVDPCRISQQLLQIDAHRTQRRIEGGERVLQAAVGRRRRFGRRGGSGIGKRVSPSAIVASDRDPSRSTRQRERIVGSKAPGRWATSMKTARRGGSSSILSRALALARFRSSRIDDDDAPAPCPRCRAENRKAITHILDGNLGPQRLAFLVEMATDHGQIRMRLARHLSNDGWLSGTDRSSAA